MINYLSSPRKLFNSVSVQQLHPGWNILCCEQTQPGPLVFDNFHFTIAILVIAIVDHSSKVSPGITILCCIDAKKEKVV